MNGAMMLKHILIGMFLVTAMCGVALERATSNDQKASTEQIGKSSEGIRRQIIVVQNYYYAKPGQGDEVYRWRIHASEVREKLGFPRGRVMRRQTNPDEAAQANEQPDVIWECEYPSIEARERDAKAVTATPEFQAVQKHMATLIRRFERGTYEVEEPPRQEQ